MLGLISPTRRGAPRRPAMPKPDTASATDSDINALRPLNAAVLSDVLDSLGLMRQAMKPFMRPLDDTLPLIGRARTGLYMPVYEHRAGENPYEVEIALVDDLTPHDVVVLACNGPSDRIAPWGELLSTACVARGAAGCVTDGLVRDVKQIREMRFPVFAGGIGPLDTKGRARMVERDVPVECAGVAVRPGDIVFGDVDGVVVIPREHEREVIARAVEKVSGEHLSRDALRRGELLGAVFRRLGIL
jgi:4-hydroxy-4-methyl-2-oxoglutarate aldolase